MQLTIDCGTLKKSLGHIQAIVEKRNTIPVLGNVLIKASGGQLSLTATDMDIDIVEAIPAHVAREGQCTAPAHMVYEIIRKLKDDADVKLTFVAGNAQLEIESGRSNFTLATLPVEDFPALTDDDFTHSFVLTAEEAKDLIDRTRFAISTEETRYYLNGIYLHAANNNDQPVLRAVATDGHRLARMEMPLPEGASGIPGVIMPRKMITELRKLIEDAEEGDLSVQISVNRIRFSIGGLVLTSKLIDGTFPDYERVIPTNTSKEMQLSTAIFGPAVDRVATISSDKSRAVKLFIDKGMLKLAANSPENGSAEEELEADYDSEAMEIGFNSRYLLDMIQQIEGDMVNMRLSDSASPSIVTDPSDPSALYVLMPMRV